MMQTDIEQSFRAVYRNNIRLIRPPLILAWVFYGFSVYMYIPNVAWFLPLICVTARLIQWSCFFADQAILPVIGYENLQGYFHEYFEEDTRWLHVKLKVYAYVAWHPFYRCRSATLKKYYHKKQTGVETKCIEN